MILIVGLLAAIVGIAVSIQCFIESGARKDAKNAIVHCYSGNTTLYEGKIKEVYLHEGGVSITDLKGNEYFCNGFVSNKDANN